jgi:hypothetical protein
VEIVPDEKPEKEPSKADERVKIDLDPETTLRALIETGPHPQPVDEDKEPPQGDPLSQTN